MLLWFRHSSQMLARIIEIILPWVKIQIENILLLSCHLNMLFAYYFSQFLLFSHFSSVSGWIGYPKAYFNLTFARFRVVVKFIEQILLMTLFYFYVSFFNPQLQTEQNQIILSPIFEILLCFSYGFWLRDNNKLLFNRFFL